MEFNFRDFTGDVVIVETQGNTKTILVTFVDSLEQESEMCFDRSNIEDLEKMVAMLKEVTE